MRTQKKGILVLLKTERWDGLAARSDGALMHRVKVSRNGPKKRESKGMLS